MGFLMRVRIATIVSKLLTVLWWESASKEAKQSQGKSLRFLLLILKQRALHPALEYILLLFEEDTGIIINIIFSITLHTAKQLQLA